VGSRRQRAVLCSLAVGSVAATVALAVLNRPTGFGAQGRYVLAFVSIVPLAAGEIVLVNRHRLRSVHARRLPLAFTGAVAAVHLLALYTNARRYAVGVPGPRVFVGREEWSPPLGWVPWLVAASLAAASLVVAALWAVRPGYDPARSGRVMSGSR
jgi:predicted nucleic acid-binding protein